jgi:hypothetical protein
MTDGAVRRRGVNLRFTVTALLLDENKQRTYKNQIATTEADMLGFVKDAMAMVVLIGFTGGALAWMDIASRLVV